MFYLVTIARFVKLKGKKLGENEKFFYLLFVFFLFILLLILCLEVAHTLRKKYCISFGKGGLMG